MMALIALNLKKQMIKIPPFASRIIYVKNLPIKITTEEIYDIFGKYGAIRQIRIGNQKLTKGTGFVVYEDIFDAMNAVEHLSGFNVCNNYLVLTYYQPNKASKNDKSLEQRKTQIEELKVKYNLF
ncbi:splicing factor 3B subunit 6-like [Rhodnius prolixus]|uniref:Putative rrm rna recognition motif protein n=1 Tax=Rhodnius prolixus TaxID=13249 RepID=R4FL51_RHOPR